MHVSEEVRVELLVGAVLEQAARRLGEVVDEAIGAEDERRRVRVDEIGIFILAETAFRAG
ncbi:MAG: hypothetical protein BRD37_06325 [Bacteroidetes bacterium QH_8_67_23]|nr:MAG: hypothetical protein BRD37_06325 [Bacteroidetes bacterium QH_8_67_23]